MDKPRLVTWRRRLFWGLAMWWGMQAGAAQAQYCSSGTELTQTFPTAGPAESQWHLCWDVLRMPDDFGLLTASETLVISQAEFRPGASVADVLVLGDARVAEIFVPYHHSSNRFHDLTDFSFDFEPLTTLECPGTRLAGDRVCMEVRDRGLAWRDPFAQTARRGEMVVLWGIMNASNYDYLMEWSFLDDGTIHGRVGMTGPKLLGPEDTEGHMHTFAWRLNLDIGGAGGDSVRVATHRESGTIGTDRDKLVTAEKALRWRPTQFPHLEVEDATLVNGNGRETGYVLSPSREGVAKHVERWTRQPFWVTQGHGPTSELRARDLLSYVNGEDVVGDDVVVWYIDSHHHEDLMRDEDRDTVPIEWLGFRLVPQNLWDRTPLYP